MSSTSVSGLYGFGTKALQVPTRSPAEASATDVLPGLTQAAGGSGLRHFDSTFEIGTALSALQPDMRMTVGR